MLLAGCAPNALQRAPQSASEPWDQPDSEPVIASLPASTHAQTTPPPGVRDFAVRPDPQVGALAAPPELAPGRTYRLPELIDIAQSSNPQTRVSWQQARQAALAVGATEATFLPMISASVVGGRQTVTTPLPVPLGNQRYFETTAEGVVPLVALQWLVFDFGQRSAVLDAAKQVSYAANVAFNGMHQKLIYDVTRTYYQYGATRANIRIAEQTLRNSRAIAAAAEQREKDGIGTTVEVAQARQQVAQSELRLVQAKGVARDSYQALMTAMGISPLTVINVADDGNRRLPGAMELPTEPLIKFALSQRPDVLASYAAMRASHAGIKAAEAEFMPKVFLAGVAAAQNSNISAGGLPTIGAQGSTTGVLIGATVPLYDAGLRAAQLKKAESDAKIAEAKFTQVQDLAVREIVVAADTLRSALEAYKAASKLTDAAGVTYDAALDAYKNGLGTVTAATIADSGLMDAHQAMADAHAASLVAAASLAFVLGSMTSREVPARLLAE